MLPAGTDSDRRLLGYSWGVDGQSLCRVRSSTGVVSRKVHTTSVFFVYLWQSTVGKPGRSDACVTQRQRVECVKGTLATRESGQGREVSAVKEMLIVAATESARTGTNRRWQEP